MRIFSPCVRAFCTVTSDSVLRSMLLCSQKLRNNLKIKEMTKLFYRKRAKLHRFLGNCHLL